MEVDEEDVRSFAKEVFHKESDPGSLTISKLRDRYRVAHKLAYEFTRLQRRVFAKAVDVIFNEFASAQKIARAVKILKPKTATMKRPYKENSFEEDIRPTKLSKTLPEKQRIEMFSEDFQPRKAMEDCQLKGDRMNAVVKLHKIDAKGFYIVPTSNNVETPTDVVLNSNIMIEPQIYNSPSKALTKLKSDFGFTPNPSPEKASKNTARKSCGSQHVISSPHKDFHSNSTEIIKTTLTYSPINVTSKSFSPFSQLESPDNTQISSHQVSPENTKTVDNKSKESKCPLAEFVELCQKELLSTLSKSGVLDPLSSDEELQRNATTAMKKQSHAKIVSDVEESSDNIWLSSEGSDDEPLAKFIKDPDEEHLKGKHLYSVDFKNKKLKKSKTKKLKKLEAKRLKKLEAKGMRELMTKGLKTKTKISPNQSSKVEFTDIFSSSDEEPLSDLKGKGSEDNEKPVKALDEVMVSNADIGKNELQQSNASLRKIVNVDISYNELTDSPTCKSKSVEVNTNKSDLVEEMQNWEVVDSKSIKEKLRKGDPVEVTLDSDRSDNLKEIPKKSDVEMRDSKWSGFTNIKENASKSDSVEEMQNSGWGKPNNSIKQNSRNCDSIEEAQDCNKRIDNTKEKQDSETLTFESGEEKMKKCDGKDSSEKAINGLEDSDEKINDSEHDKCRRKIVKRSCRKTTKKLEKDKTKSDAAKNQCKNHADYQKKRQQQANHFKDPELVHLKLCLHTMGISIMYKTIFRNCINAEDKKRVLISLMEKQGLKGPPTIAKCEKLRLLRETKEEVAELDRSNILRSTEARRRSVYSSPKSSQPKTSKPKIAPFSPTKRLFKRLKEIVDSEESSGD